MKLKRADIHVTYDDNFGIVYHAKKAKIKSTTAEHAMILETALENYFDEQLTNEDCLALESYIYKGFENYAERELIDLTATFEKSSTLEQLEIMIATDCNLNCKYCYAKAGTYGRASKVMQPDQVVDYLSKLLLGRYDEVKTVMFFGGEPTIQPKTIEAACDFFHEHVDNGSFKIMPSFTMVSNGTLIDEFMARIIAKYNIKVTISIDGDQKINDSLRVTHDGKGTYDDIVSGVTNIKKAGSSPRLFEATYTTLHKKMGYSREDVITHIKDNLADVHVLIQNCAPTTNTKEYAIEDESNFHHKCKTATEALAELKIYHRLQAPVYNDVACVAGLSMLSVTPEGLLYPCHLFVEYDEFFMGSVSEFPHSESMKRTVGLIKNTRRSIFEKCKHCWASEICPQCPAMLLLPEYGAKDKCQDFKGFASATLLNAAKMSKGNSLESYISGLTSL